MMFISRDELLSKLKAWKARNLKPKTGWPTHDDYMEQLITDDVISEMIRIVTLHRAINEDDLDNLPKPILWDKTDDGAIRGRCPVCGSCIIGPSVLGDPDIIMKYSGIDIKYCPHCGQRVINWHEEEYEE